MGRGYVRVADAATGLVFLCMSLFAIPVRSWRTGEQPVPPLNIVAGGPEVAISSRLWIDTDAACGSGHSVDSDDCLAILYLARCLDVQIVGISTVAGNAPLGTTDRIARQLVAQITASGHARIPVYRGGESPHSEAARALGAALARPLTIVALGPLTNIAAALGDEPRLRRHVVRLVAVMGRRKGHLFHPSEGRGHGILFGHGPVFSDFNVSQDPEAATRVIAMHLPLTFVPYDAARDVIIDTADLDRLAHAGGAPAWVAARSRGWLDYWRADVGLPGFYPFDLLAAAYVVRPALFDCARVHAWTAPARHLFVPFYAPLSVLVGIASEKPRDTRASSAALYCTHARGRTHSALIAGIVD